MEQNQSFDKLRIDPEQSRMGQQQLNTKSEYDTKRQKKLDEQTRLQRKKTIK